MFMFCVQKLKYKSLKSPVLVKIGAETAVKAGPPHCLVFTRTYPREDPRMLVTLSNISKNECECFIGVSNTRKLMKARGRRPNAFIVFECLKPR